jgi:hypothetical protein
MKIKLALAVAATGVEAVPVFLEPLAVRVVPKRKSIASIPTLRSG